MSSAKPISKTQTGFPAYLDFRLLREEGIRQIQQLSGDVWTDHNPHDPGITMLEVLCYALLDLGYRCNLPINELLATDKSLAATNEQFFTAAEILGNNPLTVTDFRKLLLDIRGVRNAWLMPSDKSEVDLELDCDAPEGANQLVYATAQPEDVVQNKKVVLNGLWRILLELDPVNPEAKSNARCENDDASIASILDAVKKCLHEHRNLCEDFFEICVLQDEQVSVCAHLEIASTADPEDVLVDLFERLRAFISPALHFHTLKQMLEKGRTMEEIFAGRPYRLDNKGMLESHGFIDTEELENLELRTDIHASDIMREIMSTPGILAVNKLLLFNYIGNQAQTLGQEWCLPLTPGYRPVLAPELSKITLLKDGIPFSVNMREVMDRYTERLSNAQKVRLQPYDLDKAAPDGKFHPQLGEYYSIQHEFPSVYGIGEGGLPDSAPLLRKAQAMQMKGYLLFFDQLLANYLAQLAHLRDFFALRPAKKGVYATFFPGSIQSIPDLKQLIRGAAQDSKGESLTGGSILYKQHELIAIPCADADHPEETDYLLFDNPQQRDATIQRSLRAFENEEVTVGAQLDIACNQYRFTLYVPIDLPDGVTGLVLRSAATYESEEVALREGESLTFLGLGAEHYRSINRDQLQEYSFELFYNPKNYDSILTELAETPATARNRRGRFLDHLLARFAEDFSEYALLQYKIGSERLEQETRLLAAKENYLADYPDISRNRGKGFDYTNLKKLWNTDNVTGLEKRVSSLMGINDWRRRTLSPFDVTSQPLRDTIKLLDFRGRILWESKKQFANPTSAWDDFSNSVKTLAADLANYRSVDCSAQGMYSFQLVETDSDGKECVIACHPDTYCCPEDRDAKMAYVASLFQGEIACPPDDGLGCCANIIASSVGFYFSLITQLKTKEEGAKTAKTIKIFIRGARVYPTHKEAQLAWINFLAQAVDKNNYRVQAESYGQHFSPEIVDKTGQAMAYLSEFPVTEAKAQLALDQTFSYLSGFTPPGELVQNPSGWTWLLRSEEGDTLLENLYPFETREQALKALDHALELAVDDNNLSKKPQSDGSFGLVLTESYPATEAYEAYSIALAQSPATAGWDEPACNIALQQTQTIAEKESSFFRRMLVKNTALRLLATDSDGEILLRSDDIFLNLPQTEAAWANLVAAATEPGHFILQKDAGISLSLNDKKGKLLAVAPSVFYTEDDALARVERLVKLAREGQLQLETESTGKVFNFQLTDVDNNPLMSGTTWSTEKETAQTRYYEALYRAKNAENLHPVGDGNKQPWGIELRGEDQQILATAQTTFADATLRDAALENWRIWFGSNGIPAQVTEQQGAWNFLIYQDGQLMLEGAGGFATEPEAAFAFEIALEWGCQKDAYRCFKASDGCRFSFELLDTKQGLVLATHSGWYETEKQCMDASAGLAAYLAQNKLPYSIPEIENPTWHYELCWESCDEHIEPVLIGTVEYATEAQAKDALCALLQTIKPGAKPDYITQDDGTFGFAWKNGADIAIHPRSYVLASTLECVVEDLIKYAQKTNWMAPPVMTTGIASYFRLLKGEAPFAVFAPTFLKAELRDEAFDCMLEDVICCDPEYSYIDLSNCAIASEEGGYYFRLMCGKTVWWRSCQTYGTYQEAQEAFESLYLTILELASDPDNYQSYCIDDTFCYFWLPDPTDPTCKRCIARTENFAAGADLKEAYAQRLRWARSYPVFQNDGGTYCFKLAAPETGELLWLSTQTYSSKTEAWKAFEHFLSLFCFTENHQKTDDWKACKFGISLAEAGLIGLSPCTKEVVVQEQIESPYFSDVVLVESAVQEENGRYYFELRSVQTAWMRSVGTYATLKDALDILNAQYFDLIEAAADPASYVAPAAPITDLYFQLAPFTGTTADVKTATFATAAGLDAEKEKIMYWARRYPVYRVAGGKFGFRVFKPGTDALLWSSSVAYDTLEAANHAFWHFLTLFEFAGEYRTGEKLLIPKNGDVPPGTVDIGLLPETIKLGNTLVPNPDCSWEKLEDCLAGFDDPVAGTRLFQRFMPQKDCSWGLFWAHDAYRLARSPKVYHTPAARECAREELFHSLLCSGLLKEDCTKPEEEEEEVPATNTLFDFRDCRFNWCKLYCKAYFNCLELKLPWRGDFGLLKFVASDDPCENQDPTLVKATTIIDLMALARAAECYVVVQDPNPGIKCFSLGLMNAQNVLVAISAAVVTNIGELDQLKLDIMRQAWAFPFIRKGDKFGFQFTLGEEILLENVRDYDTPFEASEDFCKMLQLLPYKTNYTGAEPGDCGPFSIEIVDETQIKAMHPATYACRADAAKAADNLRFCLEGEGFHVLEHILLRPKTAEIPAEHYWQICRNGLPVMIAVNPTTDLSDVGRAQFFDAAKASIRTFEKSLLEPWKGEKLLQFHITEEDLNGNTLQIPVANSAYPIDGDCIEDFLKSLSGISEDDVCYETHETVGDTLFEACVDPLDCRISGLPTDCLPGADPYSFWATVAIPWWGSRFRNLDFRHFVEKTLRREAPAHVGLRIGWLGAKQMHELEIRYRHWLENNALGDDNCARQEALNALMETMKNLRNVYPPASLHDCDSGGDGSAFVLLDQTALG